MTISLRALTVVAVLATLPALPSLAQDTAKPDRAPSDTLRDLEQRTDELSEAARRTIEDFVNLVGPMVSRLSRLIDDLPTYEAPEILPNGDIIIRRSPDKRPAPSTDTGDDALTET